MQKDKEAKPWLKTYPPWLPAALDLPAVSILDEFLRAAAARPDAACIHFFDHSYTYGEIERLAVRLSGALAQRGLNPGDRVIFVMQNIPQAVIAALATWMRRAVVVPLNPMYTGSDLKHYLDDSGARMVICQDDLYPGKVEAAVQDRDPVKVITTSPIDLLPADVPLPRQFENARKLVFERTLDWVDLIASTTETAPAPLRPGPDELVYLVYTSGTTGPAKGALIRHRNVVHNATVYEHACRLDCKDVILGIAPLFHITGIVAHLAIAFHLAIPVVLAGRFDAGETLHSIEKHGVTFTVAAITVYIALLNHPRLKQFDLSTSKKPTAGVRRLRPARSKSSARPWV